ncbi:hypothetical protein GH865_05055 [Rhodocyclus tenuis]|uniref:Water stress and hypersensitive response domain-containing protein n=1 Tax=Rhodocyclus tenuis TaxID=1066 RepID=A0A6L5JVH1_RHOTE|nr:hypothetical protein [Rhodocyclus gracilis]MRD72618.1 hypothetical protein [Rhodocyclus gracilis]
MSVTAGIRAGLARRRAVGAVGMLAFALVLAGCAALSVPKKPPEVSLAGIEWREGTLFEQHFAIKLRLDNPNAQPLPLKSLVLNVELAGQRFASGRSLAPLTIPPEDDAVLVIDVRSDLLSVLRVVREAQRDGRTMIDYRLLGDIELDGLGRHPFERSGLVPVDRVEKQLLRNIPHAP